MLDSSQAHPSHVLSQCLLYVALPLELVPRGEVKDVTFHILGSLLQVHILGSLNYVSCITSALERILSIVHGDIGRLSNITTIPKNVLQVMVFTIYQFNYL